MPKLKGNHKENAERRRAQIEGYLAEHPRASYKELGAALEPSLSKHGAQLACKRLGIQKQPAHHKSHTSIRGRKQRQFILDYIAEHPLASERTIGAACPQPITHQRVAQILNDEGVRRQWVIGERR